MDFAPVVDVNSNPSNPVIGVRSFSDDANTVAEFGSAFMKGIQSQGVITQLSNQAGLAAETYDNLDSLADYVHENGEKIVFISCNLPYDVARLPIACIQSRLSCPLQQNKR